MNKTGVAGRLISIVVRQVEFIALDFHNEEIPIAPTNENVEARSVDMLRNRCRANLDDLSTDSNSERRFKCEFVDRDADFAEPRQDDSCLDLFLVHFRTIVRRWRPDVGGPDDFVTRFAAVQPLALTAVRKALALSCSSCASLFGAAGFHWGIQWHCRDRNFFLVRHGAVARLSDSRRRWRRSGECFLDLAPKAGADLVARRQHLNPPQPRPNVAAVVACLPRRGSPSRR